ncbi:MAG: hypothetical protein AB7F35_20225 [Acetobacteraceae bacterium]
MEKPVVTDLLLRQGATFLQTLQLKGSSGSPIDWTGYKGRMQIRPSAASSTVLATLTTENGGITVDGTSVTLFIDAADTALLDFATAAYDVEMYLTDYYGANKPFVYRAWQGTITNSKEVTR